MFGFKGTFGARDLAIADAKAKAVKLSKSLGVKLKRIVSFTEMRGDTPYYGISMESKSSMGGDMAPALPQLPVGENEVVSNVSITYEIQ